jgi:Asp-tRNA(Asn)/Glu-tRNA(Gln) amidotransferase A subunit family amidase
MSNTDKSSEHHKGAGKPDPVPGRAVTAVNQAIQMCDKKAALNAFIHTNRDKALARARQIDAGPALPLAGVVLAVKDNIHVAGMPNSAGTAALRNFVPAVSSPVIERLEAAGAIILGKANMHELAYGITSNNFAFGAVGNPADATRIPGGSSGGSAAAVAGGLVTAALGTDTGGSVRLPAGLTGIVGFRPTLGRYPQDGMTLISPTRDTIGLLTNTVADAIELDRIITGNTPHIAPVDLAKLRLGVPNAYFYDDLDPTVRHVAEAFLDRLKALGVTLIEADLEDIAGLNGRVSFPVVLYETSQILPAYLAANATGVTLEALIGGIKSPDVKAVIDVAFSGAITAAAYRDALNRDRPLLCKAYADYFSRHDVAAVIFPTSPITARPIDGILDGVEVNGVRQETFATYIRNTDPASNAGLPGISIPANRGSGELPIGMELDGPAGSDDILLAIARAIECAGEQAG